MGAPNRHARPWACFFTPIVTLACAAPPQDKAAETGTPPPAASANAGPTDRACELLTRADAEAVLGTPVKDVSDESDPQSLGAMTRSFCFYRGEGGTVQLVLHSFADVAAAAARFAELRARYPGTDSRTVDGLGEGGFTHLEELVVLTGRRHLMITLLREGAGKITDYSNASAMDQLLAIEREIARKAIGRLPPTA